jgi:hypothetical protein
MSKIEVNAIEPQSGTTLTLGASGDTITIPSGATINNQGSAVNFGPTGAVSWNTTKVTTGFTATAGIGYFCDTTSAAFTVTLPATPAAGAVIGITDYANTFATNNITVGRNGSKIGGIAANATLSTNGIAVTFVYVDSTQGWIVTDSGNRSDLPAPQFVTATGGTITTCGNYRIHTFTGPGSFVVSCAGNPSGSTSVDYLVVAGGGAGAVNYGGGGGGGFRFSANPTTNPQTGPGAPLNANSSLPVTVTSYPITVGGGGSSGSPGPTGEGTRGSNSIFSTITSTGGGSASQGSSVPSCSPGGSGGGGGNTGSPPTQGTGNTPPVSPSQGNPGGNGLNVPGICNTGGGGGGAIVAGSAGTSPYQGGPGGAGAGITGFGTSGESSGGYYYFSGGGGASSEPGRPASYSLGGLGGGGKGKNASFSPATTFGQPGTVNTGGGGGGGTTPASPSPGQGAGGSGIVIIRYKYQ